MKKKSKSDITKDIWKVRDLIRDLEKVKDDIVYYLETKERLDDTTKKLWISDAKAFYYSIIGAWELLSSVSRGNLNHEDSLKNYLYAAESSLSKALSEVRALNEEKESPLTLQAQKTFEKCYNAILKQLKDITPEIKLIEHVEKVEKVSDREINLRCSICGKVSVVFRIGTWPYTEKKSLIFKGITHEVALDVTQAVRIFQLLERGDLASVHSIVDDHPSCEGIDAYCPECDKIYCWEHYNVKEEYDDGFYDCSCGTCPKGHERMIDD